MNRRSFIKLSSLSLTGILTQSCDPTNFKTYDISIRSDMSIGHLLFESTSFPTRNIFSTDYLIVGDSKPSPKKVEKAKQLNIKILNENSWYSILNR